MPTWEVQTPEASPSPGRAAAGLVYDPVRDVVVLFGGTTGSTGRADTWEWDGCTWEQITTATTPTARWGHRLVWDDARNEIVMFGGFVPAPTDALSDTWVYDGVDWTQKSPATVPAKRGGYGMAYDAARSEVVMYGGEGSFPTVYNQTYTWNGTNWTLESPATNPGNRADGCDLAYDDVNDEVVMFSGGPGFGSSSIGAETWVWNGTDWTEKAPATSPPAKRYAPVVTWPGQGVIHYGGTLGAATYFDTWLWDGSDWTDLGLNAATVADNTQMAINVASIYGGPLLYANLQTWAWSPDGLGCVTPEPEFVTIRHTFGAH